MVVSWEEIEIELWRECMDVDLMVCVFWIDGWDLLRNGKFDEVDEEGEDG